MTGRIDPLSLRRVVLEGIPAATFEVAVTWLKDVQRECQLVLVARDQGQDPDPNLSALAEGLVPDIEEIGDAFAAASVAVVDGRVTISGTLAVGQAAMLAHLQMQLVQVRLLGRRGGLLTASDPEASQLLTWIWEELADQLHGRPPRAYRAVG